MKDLEYRFPIESLSTGCSLGNLLTFARFDERTDLLGLWSAADNQYYVGSWTVRAFVDGIEARAEETVFRPESQATMLRAGSVNVDVLFFLPILRGRSGDEPGLRTAVACVKLMNGGPRDIVVQLVHRLTFPAIETTRFSKQPFEGQQQKRFSAKIEGGTVIVTTTSAPSECRIFGSDLEWESQTHDATSFKASYRISLAPSREEVRSFRLAYSPEGVDAAKRTFRESGDAVQLLSRTRESTRDLLAQTEIVTPDPLVNRGLQWAKINMERVRHRFRSGEAFTNDPPQDIVVLRDLAWYTLGMDTLYPEESRAMLEFACTNGIHGNGKVTEFVHADEQSPDLHDYKLNINDDTPLLVWALAHHGWTTGDTGFLRRVYPIMRDACDWILRQRVDGLVTCTAQGANVWGICSWRNIIDRYTLSGAVTEINAECYLALNQSAAVAGKLGFSDDHRCYSVEARALRSSINKRLRSNRSGFYLLNIDKDGVGHHDVTADLIFPVMTGVASDDIAQGILDRLLEPDFWTMYGVRTVPPGEWNFDPDADYQLRGGVWPNITAWIGYCLRLTRPAGVAEALRNIYRISDVEHPALFGAVTPGEFPERLHGLNFKSRGMTLSPWTPPTYHWLGVEGLLGLASGPDGIALNPAIPPDWRWTFVRNLPVLGSMLSALLYEGRLYSTMRVQTRLPLAVGRELAVNVPMQGVTAFVLELEREVLVFVRGPSYSRTTIRFNQRGVWSDVVCDLDSSGISFTLIQRKDSHY